MERSRAFDAIVVVIAVVALGCSASDEAGPVDTTAAPATGAPAPSDAAGSTASTSSTAPPTTITATTAAPTNDPTTTTPTTTAPTTTAPTTPTSSPATSSTTRTTAADCPATDGDPGPPEGEHVELVEVGTDGDITVSAGVYPLPDHEGRPWSQWGQGVVLPDGRFVSAVGDHLGRDGNSWFYEYDPATETLTRTTDIAPALGHRSGDWGYGKIHAQMVLGPCDEVITTSYWGTLRDIEFGGSYRGDHLLRYDPSAREVTSLGVPVEGFGVPTLAISPDRQWVFGEAMDPLSDPWSGVFFAADARTGEVAFVDEPTGVGFRSILVDADGAAYHAAGDQRLRRYLPGDDTASVHDSALPGDWLRASTAIAPDGNVYGTTRGPDQLFRFRPDGTIDDMGPAEGYVASMALSPDGSTLYYVPDAHGGSWENGTPLFAVDTATGEHERLVELNTLIEPELDVRVGGTYNVVANPTGQRIFVGLNGSEVGSDEPEHTFGSVVLAVVELG